jgi:hypothetical protein
MKGKVEFFEDEELKNRVLSTDDNGATSLSIMTLSITTLSISDIQQQHNAIMPNVNMFSVTF